MIAQKKKKKSWDTASSWVKKIEQIKDTNWSTTNSNLKGGDGCQWHAVTKYI